MTVDVEDGTATLAGQVWDLSAFEAALENAYASGARAVVARLSLQYGPEYLLTETE